MRILFGGIGGTGISDDALQMAYFDSRHDGGRGIVLSFHSLATKLGIPEYAGSGR